MNIIGERLRLYAVTDRAWAADQDSLFRQIEEAIDGGASIVQLREKHLDEAVFLAEAEQFTALCRRKGVVSIINDRVDIALKSGADGVHVGLRHRHQGRRKAHFAPDHPLHHGGGGHPGGGHRRHHPGQHSGAEKLRPGRRGGGIRPVRPAGRESRGGRAAAALR